MNRWRLDIEYDGTNFSGWQLQPGERTVQGVVEDAVEVFCTHPARVTSAGRTDAGVHALQQVASFVTHVERLPRSVVGGLNGNLPDDVAVVAAQVVAAEFDPRRTPHVKQYRYRWLDRPAISPLRRNRVWHVRRALDVAAMAAAVSSLIGEHDFSSYRAAGCSAKHPVRIVESARVERRGDEVVLELEGRAFLRYMVRNIAGTLNEIGRGKYDSEHLGEVLARRDRSAAAATAPARGLTLASIRYLET